jgi:hypothetical protein
LRQVAREREAALMALRQLPAEGRKVLKVDAERISLQVVDRAPDRKKPCQGS